MIFLRNGQLKQRILCSLPRKGRYLRNFKIFFKDLRNNCRFVGVIKNGIFNQKRMEFFTFILKCFKIFFKDTFSAIYLFEFSDTLYILFIDFVYGTMDSQKITICVCYCNCMLLKMLLHVKFNLNKSV